MKSEFNINSSKKNLYKAKKILSTKEIKLIEKYLNPICNGKKKTKKILIIGNGQHAKVVGSMIIDENNLHLIGVLGTGIKNIYKKIQYF